MGEQDNDQGRKRHLSNDEAGFPSLGHEVFRRYAVDPGVMRSTSGFGLGEDMARFALDRLGLLSEIQPRWKTINSQAFGGPQIDRIWSRGKSPFSMSKLAHFSDSSLRPRIASQGALTLPSAPPGAASVTASSASSGRRSLSRGVTIASTDSPAKGMNTSGSSTVQRSIGSAAPSGSAMPGGSFVNASHSATGERLSQSEAAAQNSDPASAPAFLISPTGQQERQSSLNGPLGGTPMRSRDLPAITPAAQFVTGERPPAVLQPPILSRAARRVAQLRRQSRPEERVQPVAGNSADAKLRNPVASHAVLPGDPNSLPVNSSLYGVSAASGPEHGKGVGGVEATVHSEPTTSQPFIEHPLVHKQPAASIQAKSNTNLETNSDVPPAAPQAKSALSNSPLPQASPMIGHSTTVWRKSNDASTSSVAPLQHRSADKAIHNAGLASESLDKVADPNPVPKKGLASEQASPSGSSSSSSVTAQASVVHTPEPASLAVPPSIFHYPNRSSHTESAETPQAIAPLRTNPDLPATALRSVTDEGNPIVVAESRSHEPQAPTQAVWRSPANMPLQTPAASSSAASQLQSAQQSGEPGQTADLTTPIHSEESRQSRHTHAQEIEQARLVERSSGDPAASPEALKIPPTQLHRAVSIPATDGPSSATAPIHAATRASALPPSIIQRSPAGSIAGQNAPLNTLSQSPISSPSVEVTASPTTVQASVPSTSPSSSPLPSAPEWVERLSSEAQISAPSTSIHRSPALRSTPTTNAIQQVPSIANNRASFPAAVVHRTRTGGPGNVSSSAHSGAGNPSSVSHPASHSASRIVQRSPAASAPPASSAASAPTLPSTSAQSVNDPHQSAAPGVNITQLANRVYELLVRRLSSEQQRRGA